MLNIFIRYRHTFDYAYWANNTVEFWEREVGQQREIIHAYSNVPLDRIQVSLILSPVSPTLLYTSGITIFLMQFLNAGFSSTISSDRRCCHF